MLRRAELKDGQCLAKGDSRAQETSVETLALDFMQYCKVMNGGIFYYLGPEKHLVQ